MCEGIVDNGSDGVLMEERKLKRVMESVEEVRGSDGKGEFGESESDDRREDGSEELIEEMGLEGENN